MMADMINAPAPLTPLTATARLLHVPAAWLRSEADAGRVPHLRAGTAYLFDIDLVETLLIERARAYRAADGKEVVHVP